MKKRKERYPSTGDESGCKRKVVGWREPGSVAMAETVFTDTEWHTEELGKQTA